jgi:hypothetical protein
VYEVDGRPVRDRTDRLTKLFLAPHPDSQSQARRIAEESARFNLGGQVLRTITTPLLALQFIRAENQNRSRFKEATPCWLSCTRQGRRGGPGECRPASLDRERQRSPHGIRVGN